MPYTLSQVVLEAGMAAGFCVFALVLALIFRRLVIKRFGPSWFVGILIPVGAVALGFAVMWSAPYLFYLLDPPKLMPPPPQTGEGFTDLTLSLMHVVAQAGAGFEHIYGWLAAAITASAVWLGVTGTAVWQCWGGEKGLRRNGQGV